MTTLATFTACFADCRGWPCWRARVIHRSPALCDMAVKLESVTCPEHGKGPTNVRMHFDRTGAGDLKYDSCCEKLGQVVGKALG